jgi:mannose-6-phosphate isomerase-like protein (cupin superfamily)
MSTTEQSRPQHVPYAAAKRTVWGDKVSGHLADWYYIRNERVCVNIFELAAGGSVKHSPDNKAIFGADEVFYVLEGEMIIGNPETGEMHRVLPGEASFFRKDTWHHAFNYSNGPLKALEFFHPSPDLGTGSAYARAKPDLETIRYGRDELVGQWPMKRAEAREDATITVMREADYQWRMEGEDSPLLVGLLASTEHATIGKMYFLDGQRTDVQTHPGDEFVFVENGVLHVEFPETREWFELGPRDGCHIPGGVEHRYYNPSAERVTAVFVVAPNYLPE